MNELIRAGANLAAEDEQLRTPLLLACEAAATGPARALMEGGASACVADENAMTPTESSSGSSRATEAPAAPPDASVRKYVARIQGKIAAQP